MNQPTLDFGGKSPLAIAYGMGVDSTALLIGLHHRGIRPDLILFADTGAEKPETYAFEEPMQQWLRSVGFPPIITVRYQVQDFKNWPPYRTLDENCLTNATLPSLAFGFKSCSQKWKVAPQDRHVAEWQPAKDCWAAGGAVTKAIGYDAGAADSRRYAHAEGFVDPSYNYIYPLRDWGWDRARCAEEIHKTGLPVPVKSACFMCPASKPPELHTLPPHQLRAIVVMEARAHPRLTSIEGLWRNGVKGTRGGTKKPGRMTDYIRSESLLPADEIDRLWNEVPKELVAFQKGFAQGDHANDLSRFLEILKPN